MVERRFNPVRWVEGIAPLKLAVSPAPHGGEDLAGWLAQAKDDGVQIIVSMLQKQEQHAFGLNNQSELCRKLGIAYLNLPVKDHSVPYDMAVVEDLAQLLFGEMTRLRGVLVHCFAGIGRSVVMASCALAVAGIKPARAFEMIGKARGLRVPDTSEQERWVHDFVDFINDPKARENKL